MQGHMGKEPSKGCLFCGIASNVVSHYRVFEDDTTVAFLDSHPVFLGHILVIPKTHYENLESFPEQMLGAFFFNVRLLSNAVEKATHSDGTFLAVNNKVSQSVPHIHVHIVPRRFGDGLRGFFWPRQSYASEQQALDVQKAINREVMRLQQSL